MPEPKLTKSQYEAVFSNASRIACIAGPGTGKTRTLITRIKRLLADGVPASNFLVLTFTNKAAHEIKERLHSPDIMAGTFHSICYQLIGRYLELFKGYHPYMPVIYDAEDEKDVINETITRSLVSLKPSEAKAALIRYYQELESWEGFTRMETMFLKEFEDIVMREGHALTYDMILWIFRLKLETSVSFWQEINNWFTHVFVDEYQDTNRIQAELIKQINPENLFVVGDLDQAIYAWRGAKLQELIDFTQEEKTETFFLDVSFRSTPEILLAAHNLITHNEVGFKREVFSSKEPVDNSFVVRSYTTHDDQASAITRISEGALRFKGNMAILTRTNKEASETSKTLTAKEIGHLLLTTEQELWNDYFIKNFLAYLKLLANPKSSYSFLRALRLPTRGWYNPRIKSEYHLEALRSRKPLIDVYREHHPDDIIFNFVYGDSKTMLEMQSAFDIGVELIERIKTEPGAEQIQPNKMELLKQVMERIRGWCERSDDYRLPAFLKWLYFRDMQDELIFEDHKLLIMTLHGAKGLEFDRVVIPSVVEGNIPARRGNLEEERRLLYVGITRAKHQTVLNYAMQRVMGGSPDNYNAIFKIIDAIPSRFLEEVRSKHETM